MFAIFEAIKLHTMAYINSFFHFVFRTKANLQVLNTDTTPRLYKYICGISENSGCRVIAINGMPDHIHIAAELSAEMSPSEYMREVKSRSSRWMAENHLFYGFQGWGKSYFASTFSKRDMDKVVSYISNQQEHHRRKSFAEELSEFFDLAGLSDKFQYFISDN